jgi:hypothetical protein
MVHILQKAAPAAQYQELAVPLEELLHASQLKTTGDGGGQLVQQI